VLEQIVQKFRGVVLGLVVAALSLVFIVQFGGPQGEGCTQDTVASAAEVYGHGISRNELQAAFVLVGGENYPEEMAKQYRLEANVLDGLIERELLAREARRIGFDVSEDDVLQKVADDGLVYFSMAVDAGPSLPPSGPQRVSFEDANGKFSKDNMRRFIQYRLRRSVHEFARSQVAEHLAQRMREAVTANVTVSPGEVWSAFVREKESATLKYVRFSSAYYAQSIEPTASELDAFIAEQKAAVDAEYEKQKARYTGLEKQVRARHILIKAGQDADEAAKQQARKTIEQLLLRAKKGEDFAALAREHSQDPGSAKKGGDLGYNPKGRMVKPFDDAQFALAKGGISEVVESTFGFHVIKVEGIREGDVPLDEAKRELADKLYRDSRSNELAKNAAAELLEKVKGGLSLEDAVSALNAAASPAKPAKPKPAGAAESAEPEAPLDPLAPQVRDTRAFGRTDTAIPGPFDSSPLVKAAYELSLDAPLGKEPMKLGDDWFVYRLESKSLAEPKDFTAEEQARIREALTRRKQQEALKVYVRGLRKRAAADEAIFVDSTLLPTETAAPTAPAKG
jgi:peptidyl-prolyl cis-trans isomerase D